MNETPSNTSKRKKTLLLAAGVVLAFVLIAAAVVATQPALLARVRGSLSGAVVNGEYYVIKPRHVDANINMSLAEVPWTIPGGGHYVVLWQWDDNAVSARKWQITEVNTEGMTRHFIRVNGRYLTVKDNSTEEGADVITYSEDVRSGSNRWDIWMVAVENGIEWYQIKNFKSWRCLAIRDSVTTNGGALVQTSCNTNSYNQLWRLIKQ